MCCLNHHHASFQDDAWFYVKGCSFWKIVLWIFGQKSLELFYLSLFIWLRLTGFLCIFTQILSSSKSFRFNFAGNFLLTSVPTALRSAAYAEIWDWKSTLHHLCAFPAATRGQWLCDFQSPVFHPHGTDMAPEAHLPDTIWRLKIITTDWLPGQPETSQRWNGHI